MQCLTNGWVFSPFDVNALELITEFLTLLGVDPNFMPVTVSNSSCTCTDNFKYIFSTTQLLSETKFLISIEPRTGFRQAHRAFRHLSRST